jgi:hypothetical protein
MAGYGVPYFEGPVPADETTRGDGQVKNQKHKGVREMKTKRTKEGRGTFATIEIRCDANGLWKVNGDPCSDDLTASRLVSECMESLGDARDRANAKAAA